MLRASTLAAENERKKKLWMFLQVYHTCISVRGMIFDSFRSILLEDGLLVSKH